LSAEKIAIIGGTGDLGLGLAFRWAMAGIPVLIGSRDSAKAQDSAKSANEKIRTAEPELKTEAIIGLENSEAAAAAWLVVLAVPFAAQASILKGIRTSLQNAILVNASVPLAAAIGGKPTRMLGLWEGSAAEQARESIPKSVPVLAAFHNVSAEILQDTPARLDCDILVCGDDAEAKQKFFPLVQRIPGLRAVDAGPLEMSRIVEGITALLISVNRQNKVRHSGIRITGLNLPA
jgi:NADPH-dependent F420 reductase